MKKYFLLFIFLLGSLSLFAHEYQLDATFPGWIHNANFSADNSLSFTFYHGQGSAVVTPSKGVKDFSFYVNGKKISTKSIKAGEENSLDISRYTRDGRNILFVGDVEPKGEEYKVRVQIPYPTVVEGSVKKSSLSKDSLDLIEKIVSSDIAHGFTSAQLAIVKDGQLVYQNAWGRVRTNDENGPVANSPDATNETLYDLASCTKMMAGAYAIQYLVSKGKLSLETKLVDIFGSAFAEDTIDVKFEEKEKIPLETIKKWKKNLTIRDVITHTAGFEAGYPYFNDNYDLAKNEFGSGEGKNPLFSGNDGSEKTRENTLKQIFRTPLIYEPGTKLVYSDIDFMILCFVVEKVSGKRLDVFLKETFWEPLGLKRITFNPLQNGFSASDCAATDPAGNSFMGKILFTNCRTATIQGEVHDGLAYYTMAGVSGHAGLFSSAIDLAKLASLMLTGGWGTHSFFTKNALDLFTSPQDIKNADYALGWWRGGEMQNVRSFGTVCSTRAFGHNGFTGTLVFVEPEENLVIVFLTNKINSKMTDPESLNNHFTGNYYQTANFGFVPQIVLMGLDKGTQKSQWKSLLRTMADEARRTAEKGAKENKGDARWNAYEALEEAYRKF